MDDPKDTKGSDERSEELAASFEAFRSRRREILYLRGAFLDAVEEVAPHLDLLLRIYFSVPLGKAFRFDGLVLGGLSFAKRIACLKGLVSTSPAADDDLLIQTVDDLERLRTYRNFTAHTSISDATFQILDGVKVPATEALWRRANGKRVTREVSADELTDLIELARSVAERLSGLANCIGDDPDREFRSGALEAFLGQETDDGIRTASQVYLDAFVLVGDVPEDHVGSIPEDFDADMGY